MLLSTRCRPSAPSIAAGQFKQRSSGLGLLKTLSSYYT